MSVFGKLKHLVDGTYSREGILVRASRAVGLHPKEYRFLKCMRRVPKAEKLCYVPLKTYDGSGQATHPDVLYDGERYVMTLTPYPLSDDKFENPSIYVSPDGKAWTAVKEAFPLIKGYDEEGKYNSDPDLIFHDRKYTLFYRVHREYPQIENRIYAVTSEDLRAWSEPKLIFCSENYQVLSPAVNFSGGGKLVIYWVEDREGEFRLMRYDMNGEAPKEIKVKGMPEGRTLWHLDVSVIRGKTVAVITMGTYRHVNTRNYFAVLNGDTFEVLCELPVEAEWCEDIYRASLIEKDGEIHMYTSVKTKHKCWYIYDVDITDQIKEFLA